jgi:hypothetical protein
VTAILKAQSIQSTAMQSHFSPHTSSNTLEGEFHQLIRQRCQHSQPKRVILQTCAKLLLDFFTGQQTLSIRQRRRNGMVQWVVYDPRANSRADSHRVFTSEQALRVWLEQRYHANRF